MRTWRIIAAVAVDLDRHHQPRRLEIRLGRWFASSPSIATDQLDTSKGSRRRCNAAVGEDGDGLRGNVAGRHEEHEGAG